MDVTFFEQQSYFSLSPTPLQWASQIEEDFFDSITCPMPEPEQQQVTNESPTEPIDKTSTPPVEELRVYSKRQKTKTIPDATCQTSDLGSGTTPSIFDMNYVIPVVNDTSLPIAQCKGVRSCTHHPVSDFVSYQHLSSTYHSFVSKFSFVSAPRVYRTHLVIQNGGQRCMKRWKLFTKTRLGIWLNYLMERRLLAASGCSLSSIRPMVLWNDTKPNLLQKALLRPIGLIMRKHLLLSKDELH